MNRRFAIVPPARLFRFPRGKGLEVRFLFFKKAAAEPHGSAAAYFSDLLSGYIMPPGGIPPGIPPPAPAPFSSGFSATMHSVVSSRLATDAAFCSALRTTLVGSMIPAFIRSSNSSLAALNPKAPLLFLILSTTTEPSHPALDAIHQAGP